MRAFGFEGLWPCGLECLINVGLFALGLDGLRVLELEGLRAYVFEGWLPLTPSLLPSTYLFELYDFANFDRQAPPILL